jgi:hypothetical protein
MTQPQHPQTTFTRLMMDRAFVGRRLAVWPDWLRWTDLQECVLAGLVERRTYGPHTYGHTDYFLPGEQTR